MSTTRTPTLILHRVGDKAVPVEAGRYLAERNHGAKYVELPGNDHLLQAFDQDTLDLLIDEIEEFVTGTRSGPEPDRVLVTVMFTDIVSSTERAAAVGDRRWRELLDGYLGVARRQLERFRGGEIDVAGDGLFAIFDDPARAVRCACAIRDAVHQLGLEVRAGFTPGDARSRDHGSAASPCIPARESRRRRGPKRSWRRRPSGTSWQAQASASTTAEQRAEGWARRLSALRGHVDLGWSLIGTGRPEERCSSLDRLGKWVLRETLAPITVTPVAVNGERSALGLSEAVKGLKMPVCDQLSRSAVA
jgi:hypothetical protein